MTQTFTSSNPQAFLASYEPDGTYRWHISYGGSTCIPHRLSIDVNGNLIVSGRYGSYMDADPDTANTHILNTNGSTEGFIASYNNVGQLNWAHSYGTISHDECWGTTTDPNGNVYVTGFFGGFIDADPGAGTTMLTNAGV